MFMQIYIIKNSSNFKGVVLYFNGNPCKKFLHFFIKIYIKIK